MVSFEKIRAVDPEVAEALELELGRQRNKIELIASENFVSEAVMEAMGSIATNKYAEGYPGKRYYGGCEYVDIIETLAIERAKALFGAEHANVQPHSGAQANMAVFFAVLNPGDTVLGMSLAHGGHLSHGSPANMSGKWFNVVPYEVSADTQTIDYEALKQKAIECKPKLIIAGASAYPRIIDFAKFREIADTVGAYLMVDMAHIAGLVAAGLHPSPVPYADFVTSTTHKTLRGPRGGLILCREKYAKLIDKSIFPGTQGGPLMHIIAGKAVAFKEAATPEFKEYQKRIISNSKALAEGLRKRNFTLISDGTDNHLLLIDLRNFNVTGKAAQNLLDEVNITCNKNGIPFDPESPFITSGIRLGTAAVSSRGMGEKEMDKIAELIYRTLTGTPSDFDGIREDVAKLLSGFPLYE